MSGSTLQLPQMSAKRIGGNVRLDSGETLVVVGFQQERGSGSDRTSASNAEGANTSYITVITVTPYILED